MRVTRFYTTSDGSSAFDEIEIPTVRKFVDAWDNQSSHSVAFDSENVKIYEIEHGAVQDWHNAPQRQLCVVLSGVWEIETTDHATRSWSAGELFLPDDVQGKGHISRAIEGPVRILFVPLPPDLDLENWRV